MRIDIVTRSTPFHAHSGGMEKVAFDLALALKESGCYVRVITTPIPGTPREWEAEGGIQIVSLEGRPGRFTFKWAKMAALETLGKSDVILGISSAARGCLAKGRRTAPVVMQAHGTVLGDLLNLRSNPTLRSFLALPKRILWLFIDSHDYKRYDTVVGVGPTVTRSLAQYRPTVRPRRYLEIRNGVSAPAIDQVKPWEARQGVIYSGRLHRGKGVFEVLRAMLHNDLNLTYFGDGPDLEALRDESVRLGLQNRVKLVGRVGYERLIRELCSARVVVVPSKVTEAGLPLSLIEGLVAGATIVTSDSLRASAEQSGIETDLNFTELTPEALSRAMVGAHGMAHRDCGAAATRAANSFSSQAMANSYLKLFGELATKEHGR